MKIRKKLFQKKPKPKEVHLQNFDIADFIVNKRRFIEIVFGILVVLSIMCMPFVGINYDMSAYLPDTVQSKQGINLMKSEFGYPGTARVMVDDVTVYEAKLYKDEIQAVDGVDQVLWADSSTDIYMSNDFINQADIDDYYKDGYSVMDVTFDGEDSSTVTSAAIDKIRSIVGDKGHLIGAAVQNKSLNETLNKEILNCAAIAVVIIILILCLTTTSWFEPVLFLMVMGIAILINNGTNIFIGEISFLTNSVSSILQLAVAMDYSIFLIHSFTKEKSMGVEPTQAIANALRHSSKSIISCGAATIIGFLALTLMKFSIGLDMGIVLAKGILISLLTVMFLMPSLILRWSGLIEKSAHRSFLPSFEKFGKFAYHIRTGVIVVVLLITVPCFVGKDMNSFLYGNSAIAAGEGTKMYEDEQAIDAKFGKSNILMALIPNTSSVKEKQLSDELDDLNYTKNVTSLSGSIPDGIPESILPNSITSQLHTKDYSRILIYISTNDESDLAFKCSDEVQSIIKKYYPKDSYLIGTTPCTQDIKKTITKDYDFVDKLSLLGVALVVMFTFRSVLIPILVVIPIEVAIFINMAFPYIVGDQMVFMGYIIVSCVQLGATVDYSILMTNNYLESRTLKDKREAAYEAIAATTPPVLTSGSILASVGYILYFTSSIAAIGDMGRLIGRGALLSMLMVIVLLPALLVLFDRPIIGHIKKEKNRLKKFQALINEKRGKPSVEKQLETIPTSLNDEQLEPIPTTAN